MLLYENRNGGEWSCREYLGIHQAENGSRGCLYHPHLEGSDYDQ